MITRDVPCESDEHVVESRCDSHRQRSVDDVVRYQMRGVQVSTVVYLQLAGHSRFLVHFQHVQSNAMAEFGLKPLQP